MKKIIKGMGIILICFLLYAFFEYYNLGSIQYFGQSRSIEGQEEKIREVHDQDGVDLVYLPWGGHSAGVHHGDLLKEKIREMRDYMHNNIWVSSSGQSI